MNKISNEKPAIYDKLHEAFGVEWTAGLIIANAGTIHTAVKFLPPAKIAHEEVHFIQQSKMNIDEWWGKYLAEPEFRLQMELEAYRAEVRYINKFIKNRNLAYQMKHDIAVTLASSVYGGIITYSEAFKRIQNK